MAKRSELLVLFLVLLSANALLAQPNNHGVPLVSNYPHELTLGGEQNWCITQDARGVIYVGNHDSRSQLLKLLLLVLFSEILSLHQQHC